MVFHQQLSIFNTVLTKGDITSVNRSIGGNVFNWLILCCNPFIHLMSPHLAIQLMRKKRMLIFWRGFIFIRILGAVGAPESKLSIRGSNGRACDWRTSRLPPELQSPQSTQLNMHRLGWSRWLNVKYKVCRIAAAHFYFTSRAVSEGTLSVSSEKLLLDVSLNEREPSFTFSTQVPFSKRSVLPA